MNGNVIMILFYFFKIDGTEFGKSEMKPILPLESGPGCQIWGVPKNRGTPKSSISMGFSLETVDLGVAPIYGNPQYVVIFFFWRIQCDED